MHNLYAFTGVDSGDWRVLSVDPIRGEPLGAVRAVDVAPAQGIAPARPGSWTLYGQMSNLRYAARTELAALRARQEPLGRPLALRAAMIPIKKSAAWWNLAQDERRAIFEELSHHTAIGLEYLPAVARQLYHSRDLGEPFDFITWFEYAPDDAEAFERLLARLRATSEWSFVEREVDVRLERRT
jgi:chlorite dismutase